MRNYWLLAFKRKSLGKRDTNNSLWEQRPRIQKIFFFWWIICFMQVEKYEPSDWRLFIDSSNRSLMCVLLPNRNNMPLAYSSQCKRRIWSTSESSLLIDTHIWIICVDLKLVKFRLGQQSGYIKFPCFLCLWDSIVGTGFPTPLFYENPYTPILLTL